MLLGMSHIFDQLREMIQTSGKTRYRIAKDTGVTEPHLCKFMQNKAGLSVEGVERLSDYLGLEIVIRPKRRKR